MAAQEREHYGRVIDRLVSSDITPETHPDLHEYLQERTGPVERLGAFVGRVLASKRSKEQVVGFLVGNADVQTAALFREFGEDLVDQLTRSLEILEDVTGGEGADERARSTATAASQAAYDEYVETLEAMGANPKPVC